MSEFYELPRMITKHDVHPVDSALASLQRMDLDLESMELIIQHVKQCPSCQAKLHRTSPKAA